jgi:hypothetical protein
MGAPDISTCLVRTNEGTYANLLHPDPLDRVFDQHAFNQIPLIFAPIVRYYGSRVSEIH